MSDVSEIIAFHEEVILEDFNRSSTSGNTCFFKIPTNTEDHQFAEFTSKKGNSKAKAGQRFSAVLVPIEKENENGSTVIMSSIDDYYNHINVELILTKWDDSPKRGRSVHFIIKYANGNPLHPLNKFTIHSGKNKSNNQHFIATLVELHDDETPVIQDDDKTTQKDVLKEERKQTPFSEWNPSRQCGTLCSKIEFKNYLLETRFYIMNESVDSADCIRRLFKIKSRASLNDLQHKENWKWILADFNKWKNKKNGFV